ncbi:MAG: polysaccharide biosynthesis/export family protein [Acidobacteriota bacterium]
MTSSIFRAIAVALTVVTALPAAAQEKTSVAAPPLASSVTVSGPTTAAAAVQPQSYVIGPDDVLVVSYWRDQDLSAEVVVRPDGHISLPLLRDILALGLTPDELADRIQTRAATYLEHPNVTVVVKQINSRKVFITGEVAKPGQYPLAGPTTVLQLIAMAGGVTPFAKQDRIVIMRAGGGPTATFRFNYKNVAQMKDLDQNILLHPGDTVLVP